ncbi:MAG TPA: COX15/CtaA family protein [Acidimicrobiales bacterium]|nr:COX15/CtaA family protein [Acidimicrobiales bacterium]
MRSPGPALLDRLRRSPVSPTAVRRLSVVSLVCVAAIVLTGAAVRVTGSGLGCSDWPSCMKGHLTPPLQYHSLIEFGNRMVTVLLVAVIGVTFLASLLRRPFRRDLVWLSGGLVAGVVVEAVVGGIVVYSKLNPYLVVVHFLTTMLLVVVAAVLLHRAGRDYRSPGRLLVPRAALFLSRGLLLLVAVVIAAGAATTGAAPDAGGAPGQLVAKRIPVPLREMAELHSTLALFLIGVVLSLAIMLHAIDVPERVRKAARMLVVVLVLQAVVGYTQYFTHLPAALVEVHELGATALVIGAVQFFLALTHHAPERAPTRLRAVPDLPDALVRSKTEPATVPAGAEGTATFHS